MGDFGAKFLAPHKNIVQSTVAMDVKIGTQPN